jgi:hypothetical protein
MESDPQQAGQWKTPAWEDPWLRAQAERNHPYRGPAADGALTRRDCTILGGTTFALGVLLPCALASLLAVAESLQGGNLAALLIREFKLVYIILPPAAVLGCGAGFRYYRMFTGPRAALEQNQSGLRAGIGCFLWIIVGLFFHIFALILFFTLIARRSTIARLEPGWGAVLTFGILAALMSFGAGLSDRSRDFIVLQFLASIFSIIASDAFLINRIITLRNIHHLTVPDTNRFQFSLATMLILVWGLGAWVTGLVTLARG